MRDVDLSVWVIARPAVDWHNVQRWLHSIGGTPWLDRIDGESDASLDQSPEATGPELIAEMAGRRCYQSWAPGINPNVTKVRENSGDYLRNIINVQHGSVLEHLQFTFAIEGVSRVLTHELVRHAEGTAISQESMRYVRLQDLPFRHADFVLDDDVLENVAAELVQAMEDFQALCAERLDIDNMSNFHQKKIVTSAMRRYAPDGVLTGLVWSANVRALRWIVESRTASGAEEEIRELFHKVGSIMTHETPFLFEDFELRSVLGSDVPEWVPGKSKV